MLRLKLNPREFIRVKCGTQCMLIYGKLFNKLSLFLLIRINIYNYTTLPLCCGLSFPLIITYSFIIKTPGCCGQIKYNHKYARLFIEAIKNL
jgi:hypothetical protein